MDSFAYLQYWKHLYSIILDKTCCHKSRLHSYKKYQKYFPLKKHIYPSPNSMLLEIIEKIDCKTCNQHIIQHRLMGEEDKNVLS